MFGGRDTAAIPDAATAQTPEHSMSGSCSDEPPAKKLKFSGFHAADHATIQHCFEEASAEAKNSFTDALVIHSLPSPASKCLEEELDLAFFEGTWWKVGMLNGKAVFKLNPSIDNPGVYCEGGHVFLWYCANGGGGPSLKNSWWISSHVWGSSDEAELLLAKGAKIYAKATDRDDMPCKLYMPYWSKELSQKAAIYTLHEWNAMQIDKANLQKWQAELRFDIAQRSGADLPYLSHAQLNEILLLRPGAAPAAAALPAPPAGLAQYVPHENPEGLDYGNHDVIRRGGWHMKCGELVAAYWKRDWARCNWLSKVYYFQQKAVMSTQRRIPQQQQ